MLCFTLFILSTHHWPFVSSAMSIYQECYHILESHPLNNWYYWSLVEGEWQNQRQAFCCSYHPKAKVECSLDLNTPMYIDSWLFFHLDMVFGYDRVIITETKQLLFVSKSKKNKIINKCFQCNSQKGKIYRPEKWTTTPLLVP